MTNNPKNKPVTSTMQNIIRERDELLKDKINLELELTSCWIKKNDLLTDKQVLQELVDTYQAAIEQVLNTIDNDTWPFDAASNWYKRMEYLKEVLSVDVNHLTAMLSKSNEE